MACKPELLAPAGSPDALYAAVAGGADAVYFGVSSFNARMNAQNFAGDSLAEAIAYCRRLGVRVYITLNTLLYERETEKAVQTAVELWNLGADAFIVADLGLASVLHRLYPEMELHASTQTTGQNVLSCEMLKKIGFTRMVAPRELSYEDIKTLCSDSPLETEIFIHGALCVCHSGQCLLSSVIGGRSGNRGRCAQPCRLPYRSAESSYPLSLKDLCLAGHIREICEIGPASLKIEGRMKSADYVYGVTKIYRRLLDEKRDATKEETEALAGLFSRSGFTDGYYSKKIDRTMLGIRTEDDKADTRSLKEKTDYRALRKLPVSVKADFSDGVICLSGIVRRGGKEYSASVKGETVREEYPLIEKERLQSSLGKWGNTLYSPTKIEIIGAKKAKCPLSAVNAARRELAQAIDEILEQKRVPLSIKPIECLQTKSPALLKENTAYFVHGNAVTKKALSYFDRVFIPLSDACRQKSDSLKMGFTFPPVAFDSELNEIEKKTAQAVENGFTSALITNLWQVPIAQKYKLTMHGDMRLGVCNSETACLLASFGFSSLIASPEAGTARFSCPVPMGCILYGHIPVMTLEKCVIRDICGKKMPERELCRYCDTHAFTYLTDRTGTRFPIAREWKHRNVMFNSVPFYMADRKNELPFSFAHCIFTDENTETDSIIASLVSSEKPVGRFRRLQSPE